MTRGMAVPAFALMALLSSCAKKDATEAPKTEAQTSAPAPAPSTGGPHAVVNLKDGSKVPGTIVASSASDMVVTGDDGIERKIPLDRVKSVDYSSAPAAQPEQRAAARPPAPAAQQPPAAAPAKEKQKRAAAPPPPNTPAPAPPAPMAPAVTTKTYELPAGSDVSVRTNEPIDSATATEGQTFDAQVTRDAKDANGDVVIPRNSPARVVIKSASKGGKIRGASDLVLDLQSVTIDGRRYVIDTADIRQQGASGVGANRRTAEYTGGGAAVGAIIGAIAGGGKGAAIGAGAGAGAGALTQIITKGKSIKVPVESVLTFQLDHSLKVTAAQ